MNCFNIRELQSILKNKFFADLVNSHDHRDLLNQSMIGLRFKQNSNVNLDLDMTSFYKYGIHTTNLNKYYNFSKESSSTSLLSRYDIFFLNMFNANLSSLAYNFAQNVRLILVEFFNVAYSYSFLSFFNSTSLISCLKAISLNFSFLNVFNFNLTNSFNASSYNKLMNSNVLNVNHRLSTEDINTYSEGTSSQRINRFNTVFVNYDYKTGHYLGN
jgi:hypothetical protein